MPRWQRTSWNSVLRLTGVLTAVSILIVLTTGSALWLVEGNRPDSTLRSWGDALWWSLSTITTVGYGDHVPVTTGGRLIATAVMVVGVAIIGAVAAIVALAMAHHIALEEERTFEAEAETLERRVEVRLAGIEAQLADLDTYLKASQHTPVNDSAAVATRAVARSSPTRMSH
jgi:voltage-gated potassium channel Kch